MKIVAVFLIFGILIFMFPYVSSAKTCATEESVEKLVNDNNNFAVNLYKKLYEKNPDDNTFFSPFSISLALSMTYAGARGQTAKQMKEALCLELPDDVVHKAFHDLISSIGNRGKGYVLEVANALWGDKGYQFLKEFLDIVNTYYNGGFYEVSFRTDPEGSRKKINRWVEKKTHEKIKDLLPPNSITSLTRLVITNAIYFKGEWEFPFEKENTQDMPFYTTLNTTVEAPMMYVEKKFEYMTKKGKYQLLMLPYGDGTLSMVILLPVEKNGLSQIEEEMTWDELYESMVLTREKKVKVYLPKFKAERTYELVGILREMGMKDAFTDKADFSGMEPKKELYISNIVHKAYIDVNEEGTEAAAATGVVVALKAMMPEEPVVFKADHPFMYFIIHNPTGQILFMGRMVNPTE